MTVVTPAGSRSELSNKASMLIATAARMVVGLGTFILLARYLGPVQFGLVATAIAYATFIGIVTDFGLATYALRTAGAAPPARVGPIVGEALAVKAALTVIVAVLGAGALAVLLPPRDALIYALVFLGAIGASFADLALVAVRANRRFDVEAKLVTGASVAWLVIVGGVAAATRDAELSALAFAISRLGYLIVVLAVIRPWLSATHLLSPRRPEVLATAGKASSYAVDSVLTTVSGQMDVLLFGAVLTHYDMGIYQAGARLVQAIVPFAVVLSTVYLPNMAAAVAQGRDADWRRAGHRLTLEFTALALAGAIGFVVAGPLVTHSLYGPRYAPLAAMWPAFAVFVLLRFTAAGYGIQLVALGRIRLRIVSQLVSIALFATASALLLGRGGLAVAPWLLAAGSLPSLLILGLGLAATGRAARIVLPSVAVAIAATVVLVWLGGFR